MEESRRRRTKRTYSQGPELAKSHCFGRYISNPESSCPSLSPLPTSSLRIAKYGVKAVSLIISAIIMLAIVGPPLGFLTQEHTSTNVGFSVETSQLQSQLNAIFSNGTDLTQPHDITIPVHNAWMFTADASIVINLEVSGSVVYETSGAVTVQAFQSGEIIIPFQIS